MAPKISSPGSSQVGKQMTISSFFAPKSGRKPAPAATIPSVPSKPQEIVLRAASPKRNLDHSDEENEEPDLPIKRQRLHKETSAAAGVEDDEHEDSVEANIPIQRGERTAKYVFSSSPVDQPLAARSKEKELLHQKFAKKLGNPNLQIGRSWDSIEEAGAEGEEDDEDEEEQPARRTTKGGNTGSGSKKLTPMEKQYLEIKRKHLDKVIVYQVGYKYRFFGEDARIASKELGLVCIPGRYRFDEHASEAHIDRFASASFPLARLPVHVKRLVAAGYKVGVVRQLETAALKAAGSNRNAPFVRELTNVYTKGTYIDEVDTGDDTSSTSGYLVCLTESNVRQGDEEKVRVGMIATQPAVDSVVIYDDFEDGFMRGELETRLLHLSPCEYVILGDLSPATSKLIKHLSLTHGVKARVEQVTKPTLSEASSKVSNFFASKMSSPSTDRLQNTESADLLDRILKSPDNVTLCLQGMINYLREFSLESVFQLTDFHSFSTRTHMLLNGNTLSSLEIYENQTDFGVKGSLFWTLDRTRTRFGKRLLRKWVGRPLLDKAKLEERVTAVAELKDSETSAARVRGVLSQVRGDLEKTLIRIYYARASRPEILTFLQAMQKVGLQFTTGQNGFGCRLLNDSVARLPIISDPVNGYLSRVNLQAAKADDKYAFFGPDFESEEITEQKLGIAAVQFELEDHKAEIAKTLGKKTVDYVTVSGTDFTVEVENTKTSMAKVPANWIKMSNTKKFSRFRTPTIVNLLQTRDQHKESLEAACDDAFKQFQQEIVAENYQNLRDAIQALAQLDCLMSLAIVAQQPGYVRPQFADSDGGFEIDIKDGRHPMVEQILLDSYVPNDIHLRGPSSSATNQAQGDEAAVPSALLITGPNMGGKSSYVRATALLCIMAQLGSHIPCTSARLSLLDSVHTRMGASDRLGASTFAVELSETSTILASATPRSLVILDELGRGTSTHDGAAIAEAVLRELVDRGVMTLFITHYMDLSRVAEEKGMRDRIRNVHMKFEETRRGASEDAGEEITFLYEAAPGVAHRSYGLNVARLAGVPRSIMDLAALKSREMEVGLRERKIGKIFQMLGHLCGTENANSAKSELNRIAAAISHL